jgi:hypothetical protein
MFKSFEVGLAMLLVSMASIRVMHNANCSVLQTHELASTSDQAVRQRA